MRIIELPHRRGHAGHYSSAVAAGGFLYISGQLPTDWAAGGMAGGGLEEHARQALANLDEVLRAEGLTRRDVVKTTVFIPDVELWPKVDAIYAGFFGDHRPARSVVPTTALHYGAWVEIEAVAMYPEMENV